MVKKTTVLALLGSLLLFQAPAIGRGSGEGSKFSEPRPSIPSPTGSSRPARRPAPVSPKVKPFPAKAINELLARGGYTRTRFLQERLRRILPPGAYRFDAKCPLIKRSPPTDPLTREYPMFAISCLDREHQDYLAVPVAPDKTSDGWKLLFQAPQSSKMTATLLLSLQKRLWDQGAGGVAAEDGSVEYSATGEVVGAAETPPLPGYYNYVYHASTWLWKQRKIRFTNSFLRILYKNAHRVHYDRFGGEEHLSLIVPGLMQEARRRNRAKNVDWREDFLAVIRPGRWLPFYKACPLELIEPPRRDSGDNRLRMKVRLTCLGKDDFALANLLLEENFFRNYPNFDPIRGERFRAELKFGGISRDGRKYRMDWDTINNIRPL